MQTPLWSPSEERRQKANMTAFINYVNKKYGRNFEDYAALYDWSINFSADFWDSMWDFGEVKFSRQYDKLVVDQQDMLASRWFPGAMLNFAENLLRYRDDRIALIFKGEGREPVRITYAQLYDQVASLACSLKE